MPGFILHQGATVLCMHGGQAQPTVPSLRVQVGGQPVVTQPFPWVVAGCPFVPPAAGPCVTAQWTTAALRVTADGSPVLLQGSLAVCAPTGTGLNAVLTQMRVKAA
jgi:hypothetical protein